MPDYYSPGPTASERGTPSASRSGGHSASASASRKAGSPSASVTRTPAASTSPGTSAPSRASSAPAGTATPSERPTSASPTATPSERPTSATPTRSADTQSAEEAEVLRLVNQERAQAGCSPVTADPGLGDLAGDFSEDMAVRSFFDHTDPDGNDPWDRARQRGIDNLGAENIARGQPNARAVMDSWMQSEGHRANILNCDYRTLGVGLHTADGDHWWTQEFGF
ncbi:CAP domain-containing protein [Streptomyces meridianus]|uniref:CAP domain-containing protein n=1 Tax=Streptomyces meridianus TaxID=2938945 RepID=A0ABT0X8B9_9ACTN|nr:CAP domain-containing protein [Streptomyces meridianus]MCM2578768.1 CAP domain-containing protein [Streptomyces meridianus]